MKTVEKYKFRFGELSDKDVKSLKILGLIIKKGIISRTEVSKTTGINVVSTSNYINKYIQHNLIHVPQIFAPNKTGQIYSAHNKQLQDAIIPPIANGGN